MTNNTSTFAGESKSLYSNQRRDMTSYDSFKLSRPATPQITISEYVTSNHQLVLPNNHPTNGMHEIPLESDTASETTVTDSSNENNNKPSNIANAPDITSSYFTKPTLKTTGSLGSSDAENGGYRPAGLLTPGYITPNTSKLFNSNNNFDNSLDHNDNISKTLPNMEIRDKNIDDNDNQQKQVYFSSIAKIFGRSTTPKVVDIDNKNSDIEPTISNQIDGNNLPLMDGDDMKENTISMSFGYILEKIGMKRGGNVDDVSKQQSKKRKKTMKRFRRKRRKKGVELNEEEKNQVHQSIDNRNRRNVEVMKIIDSLLHINSIIVYVELLFCVLMVLVILIDNEGMNVILSIMTTIYVFTVYLLFKKSVMKRRCKCCFSSFYLCYRCCGIPAQELVHPCH